MVVRSLFKIEEKKKNKLDECSCCTFIKRNRILLWVEIVFLVSICTAVAGGFTVPIIIYAVAATDRGNATTSLSNDFSCSDTIVQVCNGC